MLLFPQSVNVRLEWAVFGLLCHVGSCHVNAVSLLVVRDVAHQSTGSINLFQKDDPSQLMWKRHRRQAQQEIGLIADSIREADIPSQHERDAMGLLYRQSLEPLCKLQRLHRAPSLVEDNRVPSLRDRLDQARGLGAHDRRIVRALSTAPGRNLLYLDRIEVLDTIEITVDDRAKLSVRNRTGPQESKFHRMAA